MKIHLREEKKLWQLGFKRVACLDEAGRGPLAGPVVAAAVYLKPGFNDSDFALKDSKMLTHRKREEIYKQLTGCPTLRWGVGQVSEKVIDRINILEASKLAMEKAVAKLEKKPDFLILDGRMEISLRIPQKSIIKADQKVFSCMAASIIAKVTRDRLMEKYHRKYPVYGFDQHKGYPTKMHRRRLKRNGPCQIHRKTFRPVAKIDKS